MLAAKRLAGEAARAASREIVSWKTLRAGMGLLPLAILMRKPGGGSVAESLGWVMDKALVWAEGESLLLLRGSSAGTGVDVVVVIRHRDTVSDRYPTIRVFGRTRCMICGIDLQKTELVVGGTAWVFSIQCGSSACRMNLTVLSKAQRHAS